MNENSTKTVTFMVNRQERVVLTDTIIYALIRDKLCTIFLTDAAPLRIFLSLAALKNLLPAPPRWLFTDQPRLHGLSEAYPEYRGHAPCLVKFCRAALQSETAYRDFAGVSGIPGDAGKIS